jgi:hypothetical protein
MTHGIGPESTDKQRTQNLDAGYVRRASLTIDVYSRVSGEFRFFTRCGQGKHARATGPGETKAGKAYAKAFGG